jgi:hypothetical protein
MKLKDCFETTYVSFSPFRPHSAEDSFYYENSPLEEFVDNVFDIAGDFNILRQEGTGLEISLEKYCL